MYIIGLGLVIVFLIGYGMGRNSIREEYDKNSELTQKYIKYIEDSNKRYSEMATQDIKELFRMGELLKKYRSKEL
jgi:hypothetical protein